MDLLASRQADRECCACKPAPSVRNPASPALVDILQPAIRVGNLVAMKVSSTTSTLTLGGPVGEVVLAEESSAAQTIADNRDRQIMIQSKRNPPGIITSEVHVGNIGYQKRPWEVFSRSVRMLV